MSDIITEHLAFVVVPAKRVEFENGELENVERFSISKNCVTIELFHAYQQDTGYRTTSEIHGGKSYQINELVEHVPENERCREPAFCLSYVDAVSFCSWANVRLPREAEWLAASLIDDQVYETGSGHFPSWCAPGGAWPSPLPANALEFGAHELTADTEDAGRLVVRRCGPTYYRQAGWQRMRTMNRIVQSVSRWDLLNCFRVCKL